MNKMILCFSHQLTENQEENAREVLKVNEFITLSDDLQQLWSNIPPKLESLTNYLSPLKEWIEKTTSKGDLILVHGDFGAVFQIVEFAFKLGLRPVYATTERKIIEKKMPDGTVNISRIFKHVLFRNYEK
ncbi:MAG: CRISPR-associated protein Csx20 [Promethearchaeota archaeon]